MKNVYARLCIYPKDIMLITGRSYSYALRLLREIRKSYHKPKNGMVSYVEFCEYANLDIEDVFEILKKLNS